MCNRYCTDRRLPNLMLLLLAMSLTLLLLLLLLLPSAS